MIQQFYPQPPQHNFQFELNKDMHFAAAHHVPHHSAGACQNIHGHTYFVNITVAGDELDDAGFLVNFKDLKTAVHKRYDHTLLNDHPEFHEVSGNIPSTEEVARNIHQGIQAVLDERDNGVQCLQVVLRETPTSYVIYRPYNG